ncbi:MAG TPA: hypothetical protein VM432_03755, partial [Bdellovibrionales bacterium]|nr:hypothetical protein [Bdellovibrionales bacterium]
MSLACSYAAVCAGCDYLNMPLSEQREIKVRFLKNVLQSELSNAELPEIRWRSIADGGLRDRVDLMIDRRSGDYKVGLFDRFKTGLVDLQGCPQLSPDLEAWLKDFRAIRFPIDRGSIRLRVSPTGKRGVWLDFANVDIKTLLDERTTLDRLREMATVEIGQKRKRLGEIGGQLKLTDPVLDHWFDTYSEEKSIPLYCTIGSFTQPGFKANQALIEEVMALAKKTRAERATEFGSGIGNFTLPLAMAVGEVEAFEVDELALEGLKKSLVEQSLEAKVQIHSGNFQGAKADAVVFEDKDLIFV